MLDRDGHVKITDFGLCKENIRYGDSTTTFCGTPEYLAPEVIEDREYDRAVDWWGVGCVTYEMITGRLPFESRDPDQLFTQILTEEVRIPPFMSADAKDLIVHLLEKNPNFRLGGGSDTGAKDVLDHPFFAPIDLVKLENKEIAPPFVPTIKSETDASNFDPTFTNEVNPKHFGIVIIRRVIAANLRSRRCGIRFLGEDGSSRITLLIPTFTLAEIVHPYFGVVVHVTCRTTHLQVPSVRVLFREPRSASK